MMRLMVLVALVAVGLAGCGRGGDLVVGSAGGDALVGQAGNEDQESSSVKTPLVRALLQTIDEVQGESPEVKDSLRRSLREADRELGKVLGGKSKQLIAQANRKPAPLVIGEPAQPAAKVDDVEKPSSKPEKVPVAPGDERPSTPAPPPAASKLEGDAELKSPLVRALMQTVDEIEGEAPEVKDQVREMLRQADRELRGVSGASSQELIRKANQKPVAPVVCEPNSRPVGPKVIELKEPEGKKGPAGN